jgi:anaerobic ribonucleoside-triphosphate reductase activating protein
MSILDDVKLPVVSHGITMNEIPGKVALYFEIGQCNQRCKGCHSEHLWRNCQQKTSVQTMMDMAKEAKANGADAVVLMGGTTNGIPMDDLLLTINYLSTILPVGLYSGSDSIRLALELVNMSFLKWLKIGSYVESRGGLASPRTNQMFFEIQDDGSVLDKTSEFRK